MKCSNSRKWWRLLGGGEFKAISFCSKPRRVARQSEVMEANPLILISRRRGQCRSHGDELSE